MHWHWAELALGQHLLAFLSDGILIVIQLLSSALRACMTTVIVRGAAGGSKQCLRHKPTKEELVSMATYHSYTYLGLLESNKYHNYSNVESNIVEAHTVSVITVISIAEEGPRAETSCCCSMYVLTVSICSQKDVTVNMRVSLSFHYALLVPLGPTMYI